jgi:hypothetical protein
LLTEEVKAGKTMFSFVHIIILAALVPSESTLVDDKASVTLTGKIEPDGRSRGVTFREE